MNIPNVSGPKLSSYRLFPLILYIESSSSKLQYPHDTIISRWMGRVTPKRMHYLAVNYLTRYWSSHFHRSYCGTRSHKLPWPSHFKYMTVTSWFSPSRLWISIRLPILLPVSSVRTSSKWRAVNIWSSSITAAYMAFLRGLSYILFKIILWALFTEWLIKGKY